MWRATVSDCHLAQRCPRLFARLKRGDRNAWRVGLDGAGDLRGKLFHERFAAPFHADMASDSDRRSAFARCLAERDDALPDRITFFLRDHYLIPYLEKDSASLTDVQTVAIGSAMARWAAVMAGFLAPLLGRRRDPGELIRQAFHPPERTLRAEHGYDDGCSLTVTGRYDALLVDPNEKEAVVVDFKGRRPTDLCEDFTQIALYAWLIRSSTGVTPRGEVLYLEEDDSVAAYSTEDVASGIERLGDLFRVVRDVLEGDREPPCASDIHLCESCPYRPTCRTEPKADSSPTTEPVRREESAPGKAPSRADGIKGGHLPAAPVKTDDEEGRDALERLCEKLGRIGLPVEPLDALVGPRFMRLRVRPDLEKGVTIRKLVNRAVDLQVALGLKAPPLIRAGQGYVSLDLPRATREPLTLGALLKSGGDRPESSGTFPLGMTIDGNVFWADLADPTTTSLLIGGTSGSGKSVLLQSIVAGLGLCAPPGSVRFVLIDPKRVTFPHFADLPCVETPLYLDVEPALERLNALVDEMEERYRSLESEGVPDLRSYNAQAKTPLFRYVVLIDEYADMIMNREARADLEACIQRIGQKGRAAGLHLILATQRPDSKVVTGVIKANLQLKVALKVTSVANSRIILDEPGAEYLIGHGDMLVGGATATERLQGALVTKTELEHLAQRTAPA